MAKKRALITGITGQDGSYLAELLLEKGYEVYGLMRRTSLDPLLRLGDIARERRVALLYGDLRDLAAIERALEAARPDEIYNLAAQSDVGVSFKVPEETFEVNYLGVGRLVNAALPRNSAVRIYQASTSEMFGRTRPPQNESSPFAPVSPYGRAKLKAHEDFVVGYRARHGLHISSGILFNHESPRRGGHFVTRKITISLAKVKLGLQPHVELGNLDARRDWGFAGDYVRAMWRMLQEPAADDYVIATGESRSVREFVEAAARELGMEIRWEGAGEREVGKDGGGRVVVKVNPEFYRPAEVDALTGDASKVRRKLGWKPEVDFRGLVSMMARADYERLKKLHG